MLLESVEKFYGTKQWRNVVQFLKYGVAGGLATLVHVVLFFFIAWKVFPALQETDHIVLLLGLSLAKVDLAERSINSMLSNGIAFMISNMIAYILNILWVFQSGKNSRFVEMVLFYLVSGLSVLTGTGIIGFLIRYCNLETTFAFSINVCVSLSINYIIRKHIIFKS